MERLVSELREEVRLEIEGAEEEAASHEQEALGLSYTDPTKGLTTTELGRLSAAAPLVREDCETMDPASLVERLRAVAAGSEKPSKILHARYAASRAEAMARRMSEAAQGGRRVSPKGCCISQSLERDPLRARGASRGQEDGQAPGVGQRGG